MESNNLEPALREHANPLPVRDVEVDLLVGRPDEPVHPELRPLQLLGDLTLVGRAQDRQRRVDEEDEVAARPQQASGLGDPTLGLAPDRGAVLGERQVERRVWQGHVLGASLDERELDPKLLLALTCRRKLRRSDVDANRTRSAPRQPGREVRRPTAELDHVLTGDFR